MGHSSSGSCDPSPRTFLFSIPSYSVVGRSKERGDGRDERARYGREEESESEKEREREKKKRETLREELTSSFALPSCWRYP